MGCGHESRKWKRSLDGSLVLNCLECGTLLDVDSNIPKVFNWDAVANQQESRELADAMRSVVFGGNFG
jgi:hypothetical protein